MSPTNGVEGPNIIPRRRETATNGISNLVILLRKAVTLFIDVFKFILKGLEGVYRPLLIIECGLLSNKAI